MQCAACGAEITKRKSLYSEFHGGRVCREHLAETGIEREMRKKEEKEEEIRKQEQKKAEDRATAQSRIMRDKDPSICRICGRRGISERDMHMSLLVTIEMYPHLNIFTDGPEIARLSGLEGSRIVKVYSGIPFRRYVELGIPRSDVDFPAEELNRIYICTECSKGDLEQYSVTARRNKTLTTEDLATGSALYEVSGLRESVQEIAKKEE